MTTKELSRSVPSAAAKAAPAAPATTRALNPFDVLQNEIDRVFDSFSGFAGWPGTFNGRAFSPDMEVTETENAIEITTELPGMDEKDVEIGVANGLLTIRGEKKIEKDEKRKSYRLVERSYGSFERCVTLPQGVDASRVKATLAKGVLTIEVPKPAAAKAQQVKIAAS
jgi:HSP20 family protein